MSNNFRDIGRLENVYGPVNEDATADPDQPHPLDRPEDVRRWERYYRDEAARHFDERVKAKAQAAVCRCLLRQCVRDLAKAGGHAEVVMWYLDQLAEMEDDKGE